MGLWLRSCICCSRLIYPAGIRVSVDEVTGHRTGGNDIPVSVFSGLCWTQIVSWGDWGRDIEEWVVREMAGVWTVKKLQVRGCHSGPGWHTDII